MIVQRVRWRVLFGIEQPHRRMLVMMLLLLLLCSFSTLPVIHASHHKRGWTTTTTKTTTQWRGGATSSKATASSSSVTPPVDGYTLLARAIQSRLHKKDDSNSDTGNPPLHPPPELSKVVRALKSLSAAQKTFKGLDGAAHEAYQRRRRRHQNLPPNGSNQPPTSTVSLSVAGRAQRSVARLGATADGLLACELCELAECPDVGDELCLEENNNATANTNTTSDADVDSGNGTLSSRRRVIWNTTLPGVSLCHGDGDDEASSSSVRVLVLYEPLYRGGAGVHHGGIEDLSSGDDLQPQIRQERQKQRQRRTPVANGRLIVVVSDMASRRLGSVVEILEQPALRVRLRQGPEIASVQPVLYRAAGSLLKEIEHLLRSHNHRATAIHIVGRSLSGGIAALCTAMLEGELSVPGEKKKSRRRTRNITTAGDGAASSSSRGTNALGNTTEHNSTDAHNTPLLLTGLAKGRVSCVTLGAPPAMSANVALDGCTSLLFGDDIVCRITPDGLDRFLERTRRALARGNGVIGKRLNWMTDTMSLAKSSLQSHALGSEGEEARLSTAGKAYLVRPRRYGKSCSMHEVGAELKGGREALRASVLWQLNDLLMSRSMWKHQQLHAYISGLDRVQLRGVDEEKSDE